MKIFFYQTDTGGSGQLKARSSLDKSRLGILFFVTVLSLINGSIGVKVASVNTDKSVQGIASLSHENLS